MDDTFAVQGERALAAVSRYPAAENREKPSPVTLCLSDVIPEDVSWLWSGRIPYGKLAILEGDPGLGKSLLTVDVAARLTTGRPFPDGSPSEVGRVLILSAEDGLADTIRPRLDASGADSSRVFALTVVKNPDGTEDLPSISRNVEQIEQAVCENGARLVVIDPLMAYFGGEVNSYRDQDVRRFLAPLSAMAERTGASILVVRHLRKSKDGGAILSGGGSIGIGGAARSVLLVAKDPEDESRRILASVKSNLSRPPAALAYRILADARDRPWVGWETGSVEISADRLIAAALEGHEERSRRTEAEDFLREVLAGGPRPSEEVIRAAARVGISERTLYRARTRLGVVAEKAGFESGWSLSLPSAKPSKGASPDVGSLGSLREELAGLGEREPAEPDPDEMLL